MADILERLDAIGAEHPSGVMRDAATEAAAEIRRLRDTQKQAVDEASHWLMEFKKLQAAMAEQEDDGK